MKRVSLFVGLMILAPALALSQGVPPTPPVPPMPPLPATAPAPPQPPEPLQPRPAPRPAVAPMYLFDESMIVDLDALRPALADVEALRRAALAKVDKLDIDGITAAALAQVQNGDVQQAAEKAREQARQTTEEVRKMAELNRDNARMTVDEARQQMQLRQQMDRSFTFTMQDGESSAYSRGLSAMTSRQYDRAITLFDQAIAQKGAHADGAFYWKAFCQYKLNKKDDALASLADLQKSYVQSKYVSDAKVLEADIKKAGPETTDDDEIKLLAIQGIEHSDPERAVAALEGVLNGSNSLQVKKRALYVLALSTQSRAHQILMDYARAAKGNPDLQSTAISYVAQNRSQTTAADLKAIYDATQDVNVKRAIIQAYGSTGDTVSLINIMKGDSPIVIRQSALSSLGNLASPQDLWALYEKEQDKDLRLQMVSSFGSMGAIDQLSQVLKTDKDPQIRQRAIRSLGNMRTEKTGTILVDLYSTETDVDSRKAVISALGSQNNAEGLISIARKETKDVELKKDIVTRIMNMATKGNKAASDFLLDLLIVK